MKLQLQVTKEEFYKKYYQAINGVLKLTSKELIILDNLSYRKFLGQSNKELFSSKNRTIISNELGISKFNFNNYIKSMTDRKILIRTNKQLSINPAIYQDITNLQSVDFKFIFNIYANR